MARARILLVAGARPNFMKVAALHRALSRRPGLAPEILHTGQHASVEMSGRIMADLGLPAPDRILDPGAPPPALMASRLYVAITRELSMRPPALVIVVGDVTSTAAAAMAARSAGVPLAHVEAGLRAFDRSMPEEVNRILADHASDLLFTTEAAAERNLRREGIDPARIVFAGNVMVDTLLRFLPAADRDAPRRHGVAPGAYALLTVHRAENVDRKDTLARILEGAGALARRMPVLFPVHPRTRRRLDAWGLALPPGLRASAPAGYLDFIDLLRNAALLLTDSGGAQQESAVLGVPCVTLRDRTEAPVTIEIGANRLAGVEAPKIVQACEAALGGPRGGWARPARWDGRAAERIADRVEEHCR